MKKLQNITNYNIKIIISLICAGLWIYFRTPDCYKLLPRKNLFSVFIVIIWSYANYKEPLFLPFGLALMYIYSMIF